MFANTNFTLSFSLSVFLRCFYVHIDTHRNERTPIIHSLKFCNLAAISFRDVTQKIQCWETTTPGLSYEESLRAKTVCPEQSQEHPLDGSINFCCYQALTTKEKNGNQCPTFENVVLVADAASVSTHLTCVCRLRWMGVMSAHREQNLFLKHKAEKNTGENVPPLDS